MNSSKTLVVYFSKTGNSRAIGNSLAQNLGADLIELKSKTRYDLPILGYARACFDSILKRSPPLVDPHLNLPNYEIVIVGGPVWAGSIAPPIRAFLSQYQDQIKNAAFFCTQGSRSQTPPVFEQMETALKKPPIATLRISAREIENHSAEDALASFLVRVKRVMTSLQQPKKQAS